MKLALIFKHVARISTEQTSIRTKWLKHVAFIFSSDVASEPRSHGDSIDTLPPSPHLGQKAIFQGEGRGIC